MPLKSLCIRYFFRLFSPGLLLQLSSYYLSLVDNCFCKIFGSWVFLVILNDDSFDNLYSRYMSNNYFKNGSPKMRLICLRNWYLGLVVREIQLSLILSMTVKRRKKDDEWRIQK